MKPGAAARRFNDLFHRLYLRFHARVEATDYRPSPESLSLMEHLASTGPLTVGEAAAHFRRSQSAMSEILGRLERRGLLERVPDDRDRRRTLVWMSPEGLAVWRRSTRVLSVERLEAALCQVTAGEREALLSAIEKLLTTHDAPQGGAHPSRSGNDGKERE